MLKKIFFGLCILLLTSKAIAFDAAKSCAAEGQFLVCEYAGKTGLEFFKSVELANVQRKLLWFKEFWGSIYRVKKVSVAGRDELTCWGINYFLQGPKILMVCSDESRSGFKVPHQILSMIQELRKANHKI